MKHPNSLILIIIINVSLISVNQNIIMISEESRDTEDWSNDAENSLKQEVKF